MRPELYFCPSSHMLKIRSSTLERVIRFPQDGDPLKASCEPLSKSVWLTETKIRQQYFSVPSYVIGSGWRTLEKIPCVPTRTKDKRHRCRCPCRRRRRRRLSFVSSVICLAAWMGSWATRDSERRAGNSRHIQEEDAGNVGLHG